MNFSNISELTDFLKLVKFKKCNLGCFKFSIIFFIFYFILFYQFLSIDFYLQKRNFFFIVTASQHFFSYVLDQYTGFVIVLLKNFVFRQPSSNFRMSCVGWPPSRGIASVGCGPTPHTGSSFWRTRHSYTKFGQSGENCGYA